MKLFSYFKWVDSIILMILSNPLFKRSIQILWFSEIRFIGMLLKAKRLFNLLIQGLALIDFIVLISKRNNIS